MKTIVNNTDNPLLQFDESFGKLVVPPNSIVFHNEESYIIGKLPDYLMTPNYMEWVYEKLS
jgi:hypothetical protein